MGVVLDKVLLPAAFVGRAGQEDPSSNKLAGATLLLHTATIPICKGKENPKGQLATDFFNYDVVFPVTWTSNHLVCCGCQR